MEKSIGVLVVWTVQAEAIVNLPIIFSLFSWPVLRLVLYVSLSLPTAIPLSEENGSIPTQFVFRHRII